MMKKIFTFFAALACVMSMSAVTYNVTVPAGTKACYIAGEMNSWSQQEMTKVDDTHYTLELADATEAMKYKYCSGPGWAYVEKTATGDEVADRTHTENDVVEAWAAVYDPNNVPSQGETKDITVKAKVPAAWTDQITAWVWPTGGEGQEVIPTQEGEWYVYTLNCAELNIIFKNGAGWNGDANQTVDITVTESTCIEITAGTGKANYTAVNCEGGETPNPGETKDITVKAKVPAAWTDQITAWVWATGGDGQEVIPTQEDEWYVYTQNCAELNIIFKNGAGWNGDANQTVDITVTESTCIEITAGEGKATYTVVDCSGENPGDTTVTPEPTIGVTYNVTVPAGTNACYIAGELNGWSHQEMTKVDDTHYTLTVADATTAMKYKYCSGPSWDYVEMQADGVTDVQDRTYAENDVVEAWKAVYGDTTVTPEPTIGVTYNVTVPAGTNACYIAGEMNTWTHQEMTKVDDTHYTLTIAEATTTMKYKYCSGPGWAYVEKTATGDEVADRTHTENDVVEAWAAVYDPNNVPSQGETKDITVKAKVPAAWTDQITAWVWPTGGEGQEVIPTQEGEWYVYTQNCAELNIIFKNGAGWNGDANQTVDITVTESICIEITAGEGKATYTVVDCPIDGPTTDNEQVVINKKATKIVYNGQICIIRDGVMFNILGQVIK